MEQNKSYWESGHYGVVDDRTKLPWRIKGYQQAEEDLVLKIVASGSEVLEIGSGTGRILKMLEGRVNHIVGIDTAVRMIEYSQSIVTERVKLVHHDAIDLPFADSSFDYVLCLFNTLGNVQGNLSIYLQEMIRVLKNYNGKVCVSTYSENAQGAQIEFYKKIGLRIRRTHADRVEVEEGFHSKRFSEDELRNLLADKGLAVKVQRLTPISYFAIGCKI